MRRKKRKHRVGEWVCECPTYSFPHRMFGGSCTGYWWVMEIWEAEFGSGDCRDCNLRYEDVGVNCEVIDGRENPSECPRLQEFIRFNEIKVLPSDVG